MDSNLIAIDGIASAITKVVPARYGPLNLAAASPKKSPKSAETNIAKTNAIHMDNPSFVTSKAELYPPTAMIAPWPSEICPDAPVNKVIERTAINSVEIFAN